MECNHSLHWDKISISCKENYTINNYSELDIMVGEMAYSLSTTDTIVISNKLLYKH
jgi:hypothetical protein